MLYIIAVAVVITIVVVAVAIWRRSQANKALERVDAYLDYGRIQSRLADACSAR
jgi:hypothetical protein